MDLRQIKTFLCVADAGSLSAASDRLRIAQPALSRQIKLLEHTVGTALFTRHAKGMQLTEAGEHLQTLVSGVVRQLENSVHEIRSRQGEISGDLSLGIMPSLATAIAPRLFRKTRNELPKLNLRFAEGYNVQLIEWLQKGELDLAFLYGPSDSYHLPTLEILCENLVFVSPPDAFVGEQDEISLEEAAKLPCALSRRFFGNRILVEQACKKAGLRLSTVYAVDSFSIAKQLVISGDCHTFLPRSSISEEISQGLVKARVVKSPTIVRHLVLAIPNGLNANSIMRAMIDLIMNEIAGMVQCGEWEATPTAGLRRYFRK